MSDDLPARDADAPPPPQALAVSREAQADWDDSWLAPVWPMLALAWPVVIEQTLSLLVGYTDWFLASRYLPGDDFKAAMALMAYLLWWFHTMFQAIAIGSTALVARFTGAGEPDKASRVLAQGLWAGTVLAAGTTTVAWFAAEAIVTAMGLQGSAVELAVQYLRIVTWIIPCIMVEQVAIASLQGSGDTLSGFAAKTVVVAVNLLVSASLCVGWGPFPRLGWQGLAIGTACGHLLGALLLLGVLVAGRSGVALRWQTLGFDLDLLWRMLQVGIPGGVDVTIVLACHLTYLKIINSLGTAASAAHGLAITIESLGYLPGAAFQVSAATLTGQYLGAGRPDKAERVALVTWACGASFMALSGTLLYLLGGEITAFFTGDATDPAAVTATQLLRIVAWAMPSLATMMVLTGALRGAGDTRWPMAITLVGFLLIRIPGALWLACETIPLTWLGITVTGFGLGVTGAWYAMLVDLIVRSILLAGRFLQGAWKEIIV